MSGKMKPEKHPKTTRVTIDYYPRNHQRHIHNNLKRFNVLVLHRRAGKTVLSINELIKQIIKCRLKKPQGAYISPLYSQSKRVAWDMLKDFARPIPGIQFNESELLAKMPGGRKIFLAGADNPDSLRGLYLDYVILDEIAQMAPRTWTSVIRPALADRKGKAIFIGTPQGKANLLYKFWQMAGSLDDWYRELLTVDDTNALSREELAKAREEMSEDEFLQEFYCSWEAAIKGAIYAKELAEARNQSRITTVPIEPQYPVYTAWDLGLVDATAIWYAQVVNRELHIVDYEEFTLTPMLDVIDHVLKKRLNYAQHFAPHDIKQREYTHGRSRLAIAANAGIHFTVTKNIPVIDGIEAGRVMMRRCYMDANRCEDGIMSLEQYRMDYDDKRQSFKKNPLHDWTSHGADSWRYLAINFDRIIRPTVSAKKPRVRRELV